MQEGSSAALAGRHAVRDEIHRLVEPAPLAAAALPELAQAKEVADAHDRPRAFFAAPRRKIAAVRRARQQLGVSAGEALVVFAEGRLVDELRLLHDAIDARMF